MFPVEIPCNYDGPHELRRCMLEQAISNTIVFEGEVLGSQPCVCSPGLVNTNLPGPI